MQASAVNERTAIVARYIILYAIGANESAFRLYHVLALEDICTIRVAANGVSAVASVTHKAV